MRLVVRWLLLLCVLVVVAPAQVAVVSAAGDSAACVALGAASSCVELNRNACSGAGAGSGDCGSCFDGYAASNQSTTCFPVSCGTPQPTSNANPESTSELFFGDTVTFSCNPGTRASGDADSYDVQCTADGTLEPVVSGQSCQDVDMCAGSPCGEQLCEETANGLDFICRCKPGFAGTADHEGNGCFVPEMAVVDGTLEVLAEDVVLNLPEQPEFTSLRSLVQQVTAGVVSRTSLESSLDDHIASSQHDILSLESALNQVQQDLVGNLSSRVSTVVASTTSNIAHLSTALETEVTTARDNESRNQDNILALQQLLAELGANFTALNGRQEDTSAFAAALAQQITDERNRATAAENSISQAVNGLAGDLNDLSGRVDNVAALPDEVQALRDELSQLKLLLVPKSCLDVKNINPSAQSGIYEIRPAGFTRKATLDVYCDMETDGGGWTRTAHLNDQQITEFPVTDANAMVDASSLGYNSFSGLWFNTQPTTQMLIHYAGGGGAAYGAGEHVRITWGDDPMTYGVYNNHRLQDCRNLEQNVAWSSCQYSSHQDATWQSCSFSFTWGGLNNMYGGNQQYRVILGPTARHNGGGDCFWHNFGANTNDRNNANDWAGAPDKEGYIYFR